MSPEIRAWLRAAVIRAVRTAAQAALAAIGATYVLLDIEWGVVVAASLVSALLSFLTSLAGLPEAPMPIKIHRGEGEAGQAWMPLVLVFVIGFILGALCYANGIIVGGA